MNMEDKKEPQSVIVTDGKFRGTKELPSQESPEIIVNDVEQQRALPKNLTTVTLPRDAGKLSFSEVHEIMEQSQHDIKNPFEKACREWLKGCSCADDTHPESCQACTTAFREVLEEIECEADTGIGHPLYWDAKDDALRIGKSLHATEFIDTMAVIFEHTHEASGGRCMELMQYLVRLLQCYRVCINHNLMKEVREVTA